MYPEYEFDFVNFEPLNLVPGQFRTFGENISKEEAEEFIERFNQDVLLHDLNQPTPFPDQTFDFVYLMNAHNF